MGATLNLSPPDTRDQALVTLRTVFGFDAFRGPQAEIITHVIEGGDALVLMPTGGGKSLCYQIPAIVRQQRGHGVAIVISPLIALMHNQVGALHELGPIAEENEIASGPVILTRRATLATPSVFALVLGSCWGPHL